MTQLSGDALGGAVALVGSALTRLEPGGAAMPFASDVASPGFAIHPDGPVYYVHWTGTGYRLRGDDVGLGVGRSWDLPAEASSVGTPTVMPDGSVALPYTGPSFRLLIARQDGSTSTHELFTGPQQPSVIPYKAIPNGQGGYFVAYDDWGFNVNYYAASIVTVDGNGVPQTYATVGGTQHAFNSGTWFGWGGGRSHGTLVMGPLSHGGPDVLTATYNAVQNGIWGVGASDVTASGFPISDFWMPGVAQATYLSGELGFFVGMPNGIVGGPGSGYDDMVLTTPRPYRASSWLGGTAAGLVEMVGPSFLPAISQWPTPGGDHKGNNAAPRPTWVHFLPLTNYNDPEDIPTPPVKTPEAVRADIETYINGSTKVNGSHTFHMKAEADPWTYADEVGYSGNDAVAFFGHSTFTSTVGATGMVFYDNWALVKQGYPGPSTFPERTINISSIPSSARLIVIANCDVRDLFKGLWNIGPGRALVYTRGASDGKVDLKAATIAWGKMMQELSKPGTTVSQAVAVTNVFINGTFPVGHPKHFEFAFDQGGDVRLVR